MTEPKKYFTYAKLKTRMVAATIFFGCQYIIILTIQIVQHLTGKLSETTMNGVDFVTILYTGLLSGLLFALIEVYIPEKQKEVKHPK